MKLTYRGNVHNFTNWLWSNKCHQLLPSIALPAVAACAIVGYCTYRAIVLQ